MAGFVYSQVLFAGVKLGLFERLATAAHTAAEVARACGLGEEAALRLLQAGEPLGLTERLNAGAGEPERWSLGRNGAVLAGNEGLRALVLHHSALYADLYDPVALLRQGRGDTQLSRYWGYARAAEPGALPDADVAPYSAVMTSSQALIARQVLDAYPMGPHSHLLDVGGGEGAFVLAALARHPHLLATVWDLPAVAAAARGRIAQAGLETRARAAGGDFKRDALPSGADLATLVRVLYDHDDAPAAALLAAVRRALPPGGTVLVAEPMSQAAGAERMGAAYFGVYLWAMGSGRVRSAAEHGALLQAAGFVEVREHATALPVQTSLLSARVPGA
jgi:demethylspheroidene O-methyltransferase